MQMIKQCFFLLVLGTAALFMPHAKATCTTPDLPKMINVASISVPTTLAVGETIPGTEQTAHIAGNCDNAEDKGLEIVSCYYGTGAEIPGLKGVYDSGVPGIGVALMNDQGQRISGAGGVNCISTGTPLGYVSSDGKQTFNFDVTLELVKTSDTVASGTLNQSQTRFGIGVYHHEGLGDPNTISYAGNVILKEVTCSVLPKNLTVNLGDFPLSDFISVGMLSSPARNFDVTVNCNSTVQPEVKITSSNGYETAFEGVLKLTQQTGVATGVGVRMLFDDNIATFDTYVNTRSEAIANETLTIPFEVRYEQVSDVVTPGPANTVATITLAYK
ncbi:fimbrial protein [Enterobacter roggenkampii]|uniref:fimbrial protein n=1 Tax=Enterobacter TaxID=547 RepID=UPI0005790E8A|nr:MULTISPECIES: fimbrial protein [Enterobacter]AYA10897.1 type 1 fimbrial protein [Enterobacter cloacae]EKM4698446.1 fimbrial protein [Enterobacter roggenkampii]ELW9294182.1 fimbrial protein [Enterobacter roggenkampii]KUQ17025.1 ferrous iron transporter B [Enterobacter roggenkampii]MBW9386182.1 fimbrial protein [Enterobacter sp. EC_62]